MTVLRRLTIAGVAAAAVAGAGTAALAATGSSTPATHPSSTAAKAGHHHREHARDAARSLIRHALHGEVTTRSGTAYVTRYGVVGAVTSVSPTSISVRAVDGYDETFTVASTTKVRLRVVNTAASSVTSSTSSIGAVSVGDTVAVLGRTPGSSIGTPTATAVLDRVTR